MTHLSEHTFFNKVFEMHPLLKKGEGEDTFTKANQICYHSLQFTKDGNTLWKPQILLLLCYCLATLMVSCENFSAPGRYKRQVFIVISNSILYSSTTWNGWNFSPVISAFDYRCHQKTHSPSSICRRLIFKGQFSKVTFKIKLSRQNNHKYVVSHSRGLCELHLLRNL